MGEILSFKKAKEYKCYYGDVKTIDEAIKISKELVVNYAIDFVGGNDDSYIKMEKWFKLQISQ